MVRSAFTASLETAPVSAFTPVGTSIATVKPCSSLIRLTAWSMGGLRGPRAPIPRSASRTMSPSRLGMRAESPAIIVCKESVMNCIAFQFFLTSSLWIWSGRPTTTKVTSRPKQARCRAATKPSPPFPPTPAKMIIFDSSSLTLESTSVAMARPAFSII